MADLLFNDGRLGPILDAERRRIEAVVDAIAADHVLGVGLEPLIAEIVPRVRVSPLEIDWDAATVEANDTRIDVSQDHNRIIFDRSRSFLIAATEVVYHVPYRGDERLFHLQPSTHTYNPPVGETSSAELRIRVTVPAPADAASVKNAIEGEVARIQQWSGWVNGDVKVFNEALGGLVRSAVEGRREKLLADQNMLATLGVPLRRPDDARPTYALPPASKRIPLPPAPSPGALVGRRATKPEPVLPDEVYEEILAICASMVEVIERSPGAFRDMDEEDLRTHFLVQLNGAYQGSATGETFNKEGKTDILLRHEGRNLFIAECKFWRGAKGLTSTVDQLRRYATWRDTKTAILLFNRDRNLTKVLEQIVPTLKNHDAFLREADVEGETAFRIVLRHPEDDRREMTVSVLVFDVPA